MPLVRELRCPRSHDRPQTCRCTSPTEPPHTPGVVLFELLRIELNRVDLCARPAHKASLVLRPDLVRAVVEVPQRPLQLLDIELPPVKRLLQIFALQSRVPARRLVYY
jgi:hypothetical protein